MKIDFKFTLISLSIAAISIYLPLSYVRKIGEGDTDLMHVYTPLNQISLLKNTRINYQEFVSYLKSTFP